MEAVGAPTARRLDWWLAREQADRRLPSVVAGVVRNGRLAWTGARGRAAEVSGGLEPGPDVQYRIGSITKTFTAVLVLQLRDDGRLDLADPLDQHLPGTPHGARTIRQLLTHTSGLTAEPVGPWWERTPGRAWPELAATLEHSPAVLPAERRWHYSNLGFALLGEVVARLRGEPWWDALAARVLAPLGMNRTTYHPSPPAAQGFSVHPYADLLTAEPAEDSRAMAPAGQLWSTVGDLARWAAFLADPVEEVLHRDTVDEMAHPVATDDPDGLTAGYGLGLSGVSSRGRLLWGHGGSMPGFLAGLLVDRRAGVGQLLLCNGTRAFGEPRPPGELLEIVLSEEPPFAPEWTPRRDVPEATLRLAGCWYWGNSPFTVHAEPDGLVLAAAGQPVRFRADGPGRFRGLSGYFAGERLVVGTAPDGEVTHLDVASFVLTRAPYDDRAPIPGGRPEGPVSWPG